MHTNTKLLQNLSFIFDRAELYSMRLLFVLTHPNLWWKPQSTHVSFKTCGCLDPPLVQAEKQFFGRLEQPLLEDFWWVSRLAWHPHVQPMTCKWPTIDYRPFWSDVASTEHPKNMLDNFVAPKATAGLEPCGDTGDSRLGFIHLATKPWVKIIETITRFFVGMRNRCWDFVWGSFDVAADFCQTNSDSSG